MILPGRLAKQRANGLRPAAIAAGLVIAALLSYKLLTPEPDTGAVESSPASRPEATAPIARPLPIANGDLPEAVSSAEQESMAEPIPPSIMQLPPDVLAALEQSSLRGSRPDGALHFGPDQRLRIDLELRRHVEWWLSLLGEMPLARIRALLASSLQAYQPQQAAQVMGFFDRWVDYLRAADSADPFATTEQRLQALSDLRWQWFGDDAAALFGAEEGYTRHVLARQQALTDPGLSATERQAALEQAQSLLSEEQRQMRHATMDPMLASEQTAQFEALNVDPRLRHQERSALWGADAADRLAALDTQRAQWDARVQSFRHESEQIQGRSDLSPAARQAQIQALLERDFDEAEARRVQAMLEVPPSEFAGDGSG